jgi:hypothetical protein
VARFILALGRSLLDFIIWVLFPVWALTFELWDLDLTWHLDFGIWHSRWGGMMGQVLSSYYQRVIDRWNDCAILYTIYTELQELNPEESKEVRQGYKKDRGYKKARWG